MSTITPGPSFNPTLFVTLSLHPKNHDPTTFATLMETLLNDDALVYERGLAAWCVGRLLQINAKHDQYYLRKQILDRAGEIADAVVDVIGDAKNAARKQQNQEEKKSSPKRSPKKSPKRKPNPIDTTPLPSPADCSLISKNASLLLIMLTTYQSDPDPDPYTYKPPSTPLHRMSATMTPQAKVHSEGSLTSKEQLMMKNRRKTKARGLAEGSSILSASSIVKESVVSSDTLPVTTATTATTPRSSDVPITPPEPGRNERTYFRKTDNKIPDLLLEVRQRRQS